MTYLLQIGEIRPCREVRVGAGKRQVPAFSPQRRVLVMPAAVAARAVVSRTSSVSRLGDRGRGGIAQIGREHQYQRRNDAEGQKCVKRRQNSAQVARRTTRKMPGNRAGRQSAQSGYGARPGSDFEPRPALRALHVVRARRSFRRRDFGFAMRTDANGHKSPPGTNADSNRNRAPMKRT